MGERGNAVALAGAGIAGLEISGITGAELTAAFHRVVEEHQDAVASIQRSMAEADDAYRKYLDPRYEPDEAGAKKDRAALNKAEKNIAEKFASLKTAYEKPLERIEANIKAIRGAIKTASGAVDGAVKAYEEKQRAAKREEIRRYFESLNFGLLPLERLFNDRWLNKGFKTAEVREELDGKIAEVYRNIELLEGLGPQGMTAKAFYLETLDMGAALRRVEELKANAEKLAREQAEREERKLREQVEENRREQEKEERERVSPEERAASLAAEALGLPEEAPEEGPEKPVLVEYVCRFWGTEESLRAMRRWMTERGIAYERIEDYYHLKYD